MRRLPLKKIKPGDELAGTIRISSPQPDVTYRLRLKRGSELTQQNIDKLENLGISPIPVKDKETEDLNDFVYDEEVERTQQEVRQSFDKFQSGLDDGDLRGEDVARLRNTVNDLIDSLQGTNLMAAYTNLKTHDDYTAQHSLDVAKISLQLAMKYEQHFRQTLKSESSASRSYINKNMLKDIGLGSMLHDLGKRHVPTEILNKPESLDDDEWDRMAQHPEKGYRDLDQLEYKINAPVKVPARQHHEKFDGSGYPLQLEGKDIHLLGRLTAPADVYSALTSKRPYRKGKSVPAALSIMERMQDDGPHFDPEIYEKFKTIVLPYPIGQEVTLSDGRSGVVCSVDEENPEQPTVRVLEKDGERVDSPEEIRVTNEYGELRIVEPSADTENLVRA